MQKGIVKHFVKFAALFFYEFSGARHAVKFVDLSGGNLAVRDFAELVEFVHIDGT